MKLITRDTDYAVRALSFIANHKKAAVPVSELVAKLNIPRPFLRKIMQELQKSGILNSAKGAGGGFTLKKDPEKIYLADLMEIFQGAVEMNKCIFNKRICPNRSSCVLRAKVGLIEDRVINSLKSINIAQLSRRR